MKIALVFILVIFFFTNLHAEPPFNREKLRGLRWMRSVQLQLDLKIKESLKSNNNVNKKNQKPLFSDAKAAFFIALHAASQSKDNEKNMANKGHDTSETMSDYQYFLKNADDFKKYIDSTVRRINEATNQQERSNAVFGNEAIKDLTELLGNTSVNYPEKLTAFPGEIEMVPSIGDSIEDGTLVNFVLRLNDESRAQVTQAASEAIKQNTELRDLDLEISTATGTGNRNKRQITLGLRQKCESKEKADACKARLNKEISDFKFNTKGELKLVVPDDIRYELLVTSMLNQESNDKLDYLRSELQKVTGEGNKIPPFGITQAVKCINPDENALKKFLKNTTYYDATHNYLKDIDFPIVLEEVREESN